MHQPRLPGITANLALVLLCLFSLELCLIQGLDHDVVSYWVYFICLFCPYNSPVIMVWLMLISLS